MPAQEIRLDEFDQSVQRQILLALNGLRYGSVEITVHNSQIVQIERKEKFRFTISSDNR